MQLWLQIPAPPPGTDFIISWTAGLVIAAVVGAGIFLFKGWMAEKDDAIAYRDKLIEEKNADIQFLRQRLEAQTEINRQSVGVNQSAVGVAEQLTRR
jgi:hypothetical protein